MKPIILIVLMFAQLTDHQKLHMDVALARCTELRALSKAERDERAYGRGVVKNQVLKHCDRIEAYIAQIYADDALPQQIQDLLDSGDYNEADLTDMAERFQR